MKIEKKNRVGKSCFYFIVIFIFIFIFQRGNNGLVSHIPLVVEEREDIDAV
jgi:hypothetical protein